MQRRKSTGKTVHVNYVISNKLLLFKFHKGLVSPASCCEMFE